MNLDQCSQEEIEDLHAIAETTQSVKLQGQVERFIFDKFFMTHVRNGMNLKVIRITHQIIKGDALEAEALFKKYPHMISYLDDITIGTLFDDCILTCMNIIHYYMLILMNA